MNTYTDEAERLAAHLRGYDRLLVAYSGGVDSTYLMHAAHAVLGEKVCAVFVDTPLSPAAERRSAVDLAEARGWCFQRLEADPLTHPDVAANPPDRCYYCKRLIFAALGEIAAGQGAVVADGSNVDDKGDHRPGRRALKELGVVSPLLACGLGKDAIRALSRDAGLPTWDHPSGACLASRIPYGTPVTKQRLARIDRAEAALRALGFPSVRVRDHGEVARLEVPPARIAEAAARAAEMSAALHGAGFAYAALDLDGYATGSLNRTLAPDSVETEPA